MNRGGPVNWVVIVGALALAAGTWKRMSDALGRQPETSADMLPISKAGAWEAFEATDTSGEPVCARPQPRQPPLAAQSWSSRGANAPTAHVRNLDGDAGHFQHRHAGR
jgi:hypothetical protein